ncbi:MAG: fructosamine kinase family protein [Gammaproteobacteria bacterium]|nr:fructosamine kinase family protein [Gammaproteobacteria bacterium]
MTELYSPPISVPAVARAISRRLSGAVVVESVFPVAGGCINQALGLRSSAGAFFVKYHRADRVAMFHAECAGLAALAATNSVRVPHPVCAGVAGDWAFLVLEHVPLEPLAEPGYLALGRALAELHRHRRTHFGWDRDNTIGATPQPNPALGSWPEFWRRHRLEYQLRLAADNGYTGALQTLGDQLLGSVPVFFRTYTPQPSLLHGDLWVGNAAAGPGNEPVIFDPAVYYGDRETDIAMTELFGGFSERFYAGYRESWPLDSGYRVRRELYNLYHVLNHLNLFGGGYLRQAQSMIRGLLSEV